MAARRKEKESLELVEFFDPYNSDHSEAYIYLHNYGKWPDAFVKEAKKNRVKLSLIGTEMVTLKLAYLFALTCIEEEEE